VDTNEQQNPIPSLRERISDGVDAAYAQHSYVLEGEPSKLAVEDKVYGLVSAAVVNKRADRGTIAITRRSLMSSTFGQVPGPEAWAEQDDPELAAGIYSALDGQVWRLVSAEFNGKIQRRLNGDTGLILCRTKATPNEVEAVYVTTDLQCLLADFSGPQKNRITKEADRMAANLGMAVLRQPEYAKRLNQELISGMKTALESAKVVLMPALESAKVTAGGENEGSDGEGQ
jgi:hypothetical protein